MRCLVLLLLVGCNDYLTGQDQPPEGPLQVTRLTLLDNVSRDATVFTDTSIPDCSRPENQDTDACAHDINHDKFSPVKSPPTPDSGRIMRVVFNKAPLHAGSMEIFDMVGADVVDLKCADCTGVPPLHRSLFISGGDTSSDPTDPNLPYGPSLLVQVATDMDSLAALEPESAYTVQLSPMLADRDGNRVELDPRAQGLLRFTTEPFRVLRFGIGNPKGDARLYKGEAGAGDKLANNGVIVLQLNASVDRGSVAGAGSAVLSGQMIMVNVGCDTKSGRVLYLSPVGGLWGGANTMGTVQITLKGGLVHDLSQAAAHPAGMGRHTLKSDFTLNAILAGQLADDTYPGPTADMVPQDCK